MKTIIETVEMVLAISVLMIFFLITGKELEGGDS